MRKKESKKINYIHKRYFIITFLMIIIVLMIIPVTSGNTKMQEKRLTIKKTYKDINNALKIEENFYGNRIFNARRDYIGNRNEMHKMLKNHLKIKQDNIPHSIITEDNVLISIWEDGTGFDMTYGTKNGETNYSRDLCRKKSKCKENKINSYTFIIWCGDSADNRICAMYPLEYSYVNDISLSEAFKLPRHRHDGSLKYDIH